MKTSDRGVLLRPPRWRCVKCVIHHEWDVREEHHIYVARTSNNTVIMARDLYCACCHSAKLCANAARAFPIATVRTEGSNRD